MCFAYCEKHCFVISEPGFQLCIYVHKAGDPWVELDNWSGYSNSFGKGTLSIPSISQLEESSDVTWYSSSSRQKTFPQQKQMLGLQPPSASQRCFEESIIQLKIQFSLKQLTRLACIPTDQPGEATAPSSKTGKLMAAVEALVGKLSPVQPWNQCLFHSFRHTTSPVLRVNSTPRLWG